MAEIAGYILAGGNNSRMNGEKKLFLTYQEKPFYQRIESACTSLSGIYLSVEEKAPYEHTGLPLVVDRFDSVGPMGGICTGLLECPEEALFVLACDMPLINEQTVRLLAEAYEQQEHQPRQIVIAETADGFHPLCGIYPKHAGSVMEEMIREGSYRMMQLLKRVGYKTIRLDDEAAAVTNVNTPEDLRLLLQRME